ncbi:uncharacterized protein TM35_000045240 [Trypanosoma theileri]|uniref:Uncharacterized protein n=1 Tax=Trypanosoma theileri TaxID=67003 RepID=A0A1X0P7A8_9TRYP|nr:uncharacterized protein TM35_000045240 [Trypanosoma theileri]ORC92310.1 hypothetical protein TM35_000045240 [Trypanosoma theileri]
MRLTIPFRLNVLPDAHRYAQATFHEGTHRQAPGDSTPWRDVSSPLNRIKVWWLAPAAKGSMIAAWCITLVLGAYCFSIQQDAKGTYLLNNVLLRNLHEETLRADANQERAKDLQKTLKTQLEEEAELRKGKLRVVKQYEEFSDNMKKGLVNYELELSRERARADVVHERNQALVDELIKVRQELSLVKKENVALTTELQKLQKLSKKFA